MIRLRTCALRAALFAAIVFPAHAGLLLFDSITGSVGLSTDGWGSSLASAGTISASVPSGGTVLRAWLYTAYLAGSALPSITGSLDGVPVAYSPRVDNVTACCGIGSARADVTPLVAAAVNGGPGGLYDFTVGEGDTALQDGEALVVIYSLPSLPVSTIAIFDGYSAIGGDWFTANFAAPLNPAAPGIHAEMRLGIGFSCCLGDNPPDQFSTVSVNGTAITNSAGNLDDGTSGSANGDLITIGGFDDPVSPFLPDYASDHERYDLVPRIRAGDTSISVHTENPSGDDNIFLAAFQVSGQANFANAPEPATFLTIGVALLGGAVFAGRPRRYRPGYRGSTVPVAIMANAVRLGRKK